MMAAKQAENLDIARKLSVLAETDEVHKRGNILPLLHLSNVHLAVEHLEKSLEIQNLKLQKLEELYKQMQEKKNQLEVPKLRCCTNSSIVRE